MRLKAFISTYLLFLIILFTSVGIVSLYLNNSQIDMLKNRSASQFLTIVNSLDREIALLWERDGGRDLMETDFFAAVYALFRGYSRYYNRHNIGLFVTDLRFSSMRPPSQEISFHSGNDGHIINITSLLGEPFGYFLLDYYYDISDSIAEMRAIQNALLLSAVAFSAIAAAGLYFILSSIFKPLTVVANASRKIAGGKYGERIPVKAKNELSQVAVDFNSMAERIERQIILLENEAENKQLFVDNFAHEMRTPLTSIYGYAEYMQKALLEEDEIIDLSGRIMNRAGYLHEIAISLLRLAMLRDYTPDRNEIRVCDLFREIAQTLIAQTEGAGVQLICKPDADVLIGQEDLIKSLMTNLCLNAIQSCASGKGIVTMAAKNDNAGVTLSVTDNGCGIPAGSIPKVTEPFYRVDKARSRKEGGAGLGLALCRRIAEAHGAELTIESETGAGTTVKITFTTP